MGRSPPAVVIAVLGVAVACSTYDDAAIPAPDDDAGATSDAQSSTPADAGRFIDATNLVDAQPDGTTPPLCTKSTVSTLGGTGEAGKADGVGNKAMFNAPEGITANPEDGTLYVGDVGNKLVRKVLANGTVSSPMLAAVFQMPARLAFQNGELAVLDRGQAEIYHFGLTPNPTLNDVAFLMSAFAVGFSPMGTVYATQSSGCYVSRVKTGLVETFSGSGGAPCGPYVDGDKTTARFSNDVADIEFDGNTMYVVDAGNFRIRKVDQASGAVTTFAGSVQGQRDGKGDAAQFESPRGLAVDLATHIVYVADKSRIRAITQDGTVSTLLGSVGFQDGQGCSAKFGDLKGIAYYGGALFAVDGNRIRKITLP